MRGKLKPFSAADPSLLQLPIGNLAGLLILRAALFVALACQAFFSPLSGWWTLARAAPLVYAVFAGAMYQLRRSGKIADDRANQFFFVDLAACLIVAVCVERTGSGLYTILLLVILAATFLKRPALILGVSASAAIVYGALVMPSFPFGGAELQFFYQRLALFVLITLFGVHIAEYAAVIERRTAARYEERLAWMQRLSMVGKAMAAVLHEAKTPLGTIVLNAEAGIKEADKGKNPSEELRTIAEEADRATAILQNFLDFVKPTELELIPMRVHEPLLQAIDMTRVRLDERGVELSLATLNDCAIEGSARHLVQVFSNIINNAVDAMPSGGKLKIWMERRDGLVRVNFEDTGVGMAPNVQEKLFEPFFTSKPDEQGHGLGLSIVRWILQVHRGDIEITSEGPGRGSLVTLTIPLG